MDSSKNVVLTLFVNDSCYKKKHHLQAQTKERREGGHERNDSTTINYLARSSLFGNVDTGQADVSCFMIKISKNGSLIPFLNPLIVYRVALHCDK